MQWCGNGWGEKMPVPQADETLEEFLERCIPQVIADGTADDPEQASAVCYALWEDRDKAVHVKSGEALLDLDLEIAAWREAFRPILERAVARVGADAFADLDIDIQFDLDRPEVRALMDEILDEFARKTNETTFSEVAGVFRQAELEGLSIEGIMERIADYFTDRTTDYQLERIARTTMTAVNNAGDMAAWGQTQGAVVGKMWLAIPDNRVRDAHSAAHGQVRRLGEMYEVGGELLAYPGDPAGSAGNVINCRCSQAPVLRGEL